MNIWLISDTHLNHGKIKTYCQRPDDFTERIHRNILAMVRPEDLLIHLGDVGIGKPEGFLSLLRQWVCRKLLVRGNHDENHSCSWWMRNGFDWACDGMLFRGVWLSHKPAEALPAGAQINIHGHLHNIWHGFHKDAAEGSPEAAAVRLKRLIHPWQRLFAVEYTDYKPVPFDKFVAHPDRYQARRPKE